MKKGIIAIMCAVGIGSSLAACTGNKDADPSSAYNLDYESESIQEMSSDKVERSVLKDVAENWLGKSTMFIPGVSPQADYTYEDFVNKIGVDATTYQKYVYNNSISKENKELRQYTWQASDQESSKFSAFFEDRDGKWLLWGSGSVNL